MPNAAIPTGRPLLAKLLAYRVFPDDAGKMSRSVSDVAGGLLLVPQFTLAADTQSGTRPSFTPAAAPEEGRRLFDYFVEQARRRHAEVATGQFGTQMQVSLTDDGPGHTGCRSSRKLDDDVIRANRKWNNRCLYNRMFGDESLACCGLSIPDQP